VRQLMTVDWGNVFLGGLALANLGGAVFLVRLVIAPVVQSVKCLTKDIEALYEGRNGHERRITKIETVHELKGCGKPQT